MAGHGPRGVARSTGPRGWPAQGDAYTFPVHGPMTTGRWSLVAGRWSLVAVRWRWTVDRGPMAVDRWPWTASPAAGTHVPEPGPLGLFHVQEPTFKNPGRQKRPPGWAGDGFSPISHSQYGSKRFFTPVSTQGMFHVEPFLENKPPMFKTQNRDKFLRKFFVICFP